MKLTGMWYEVKQETVVKKASSPREMTDLPLLGGGLVYILAVLALL